MESHAQLTGIEKDVGQLFIRNGVIQALSLVRNLIVLPLIAPGELGLFRYVMVLCGYSVFFHGGALTVFGFRYPERRAAGDEGECSRLQGLAVRASVAGTLIGALFLGVALAWSGFGPTWLTVTVAALGALALPATYVSGAFRARGLFSAIAKNDVIAGLCSLGILVPATLHWGLPGLIVGALTTPVFTTLLGARWFAPRHWVAVSGRYLGAGLLSGGILTFSALVNRLSLSVDIVLLQKLLPQSSAKLGYYAFCAATTGILYTLMGAVADVQGLEFLRIYGHRDRGRGLEEVTRQIEILTARDCCLAVFAASGMSVALGTIVPTLLGAYAPALQILGMFLVAVTLLRWKTYSVLLLNIAGRTRWVTLGSAVSVLILMLHALAVHSWFGDSLLGFGLLQTNAYLWGGVFPLWMAFSFLGRRSEARRFLVRLGLAHLPLSLLLLPAVLPPGAVALGCVGVGLLVPLACAITFQWTFPGAVTAALRMLRYAVPTRRVSA